MKPLVSTQWLADNLGEVLVFDCTKYLPNEGRDAISEFAAAHIPGAGYFDVDAIADTDTDLPHMLPAAGRFARMVGDLGISNAHRIVFYDQKGLFSAARGWWMMSAFGHDKAAVLDGGLPKWIAEGRMLEAGPARQAKPATFSPAYRANRVRGIGDMRDNLISKAELVIDARAAGRFKATAPEPRPGMRGGHIPGSVSLPISEVLAADQTLLGKEELRARFRAVGADGSRPVVTSCGSGMTATILSLAMAHAGLPQGAVYDGSWTEWGGRTDTPVEV